MLESKLVYLYLLDNPHNPYSLTKKHLAFDTNEQFFKSVYPLAKLGLINQHPALIDMDYRKAKATSLTVEDRSHRAILWAVTDYEYPVPFTEEEAKAELIRLAQKNEKSLWDYQF